MRRWGGNRKRVTVGQRWSCAMVSTRHKVCEAAGPVLALLAGFGMTVGGSWTWATIADSPHFRLQRAEVVGAVALPEHEVLAACGLAIGGTRVLGLNESNVVATCEADPRIRSARVESFLPDRIRVVVEEQRPVLAVATDRGVWLVNAFAETYAPWDPMDVVDLPLMVGSSETATAVQREPLLREAVALLRTTGREVGPWEGQGLLIEHDPTLGFTIAPTARGMSARFGLGPFPPKMKRLKTALEVVKRRGLPVAEAYLDDGIRPGRVTLRLGGFGPFADADRGDRLGRVP